MYSVNLLSVSLWRKFLFRKIGSFIPPSSIKNKFYQFGGIAMGKDVFIGEYVYIIDGFEDGLIELELEAVLSPRVTLVAMAKPGSSFLARDYEVVKIGKISIGEGAWIGAGAVVLPSVTIGKGAIIGANAVVTKDIGEFEVWAGNPAKFIKSVKSYNRISQQ